MRFVFSPILKISHSDVRISRSVSEDLFNFEIQESTVYASRVQSRVIVHGGIFEN